MKDILKTQSSNKTMVLTITVVVTLLLFIFTSIVFIFYGSQHNTPAKQQVTQPSAKYISLDEVVTLKEGQTVKLKDSDFEITVDKFYNSPCKGECLWSGVGVGLQYKSGGETQKGIDLTQAFGHKITIVKTDHATFVTLKIAKI